jgi:hypothetical protein
MELLATLLGDGTFAVAVVGVSSCQPELEEICAERFQAGEEHAVLAVLIPEAANPYSPEAVRVQIQRQIVGYLSQRDAHAFRALLGRESACTRYRCRAKIQRAQEPGEGGQEQRSVWLDLCLPSAAPARGHDVERLALLLERFMTD